MKRLPRLALAAPRDSDAPSMAGLALLAGLRSQGARIQHFRTHAQPVRSDWAGQITGLPGRHLDAWMMPGTACRDAFLRGMRRAELAVIEGQLDEPDEVSGLRPLIEDLALPILAVVPCRGLADLHLPGLPATVDAVILDGLERPDELDELRRAVDLLTGRPVLGAIESLPAVRRALARNGAERPLPEEAIARLARSFLQHSDLAAIRNLARSREWNGGPAADELVPPRHFRVAYASDEAFGGCLPDTIEMLEGLGAELVEFSPLRSEALPEGIDLVILGCGAPEAHAVQLASNASLIGALKHLVCRGVRLYAEGGGAAYLGRSMILGDHWVPGAGILPFDALLQSGRFSPERVVRTLSRDSWLGPKGTEIRGYRSCRWSLEPAPEPTDCPARSGCLSAERDLYFRHNAVGSLVHLNLASLPHIAASFREPRGTMPAMPRPTRSET